MWSSYDIATIRKSKEGKKIIMSNSVMIAVKYSSMQRPGAVINCLVKAGAILGGFPETGQLKFLIRAHSRCIQLSLSFAPSAKRPSQVS